jgi:DNA repair protein RadA/Sms
VVNGLDRNRLALVLAVLGRHGGIGLGSSDVFVNVVGGVRIEEPGADLAVALAVASAARGVALARSGERVGDAPPPLACFGELGLTGELRWVGHAERRVAEARKFGVELVIAPPESGPGATPAATLRAAIAAALPGATRPRARAAA